MSWHRMRIMATFAGVPVICQCGGGDGTPVTPTTGAASIRFISGQDIKDTIEATTAVPLVVELRDAAGAPVAGAPLKVTLPIGSGVILIDGGATSNLTLPTDAAGRIELIFRLGSSAGTFPIKIVEGALGLSDSVIATVLPGRPTRLALAPRDTAVMIGRSLRLSAQSLDRRGNTSPATPALASTSSQVSVSDGGLIAGIVAGRATITAAAGSLHDSIMVSVVPRGRIVAFATGNAGVIGGLYAFDSDGSDAHWIVTRQIPSEIAGTFGAWPVWSPDAKRIAFLDSPDLISPAKLQIVDSAGKTVTTVADGASDQYPPQFSGDGQWIYFTRGVLGSQMTIWRVHPDGSGLAQVSEVRSFGVEALPSPSPVDDRIAYETNVGTNSSGDFAIRTISTTSGAIQRFDVPGSSPRWSPTGDRIAYLSSSNELWMMDSSGVVTGRVGAGIAAAAGFAWTADGDWVIAVNPGFTGASTLRVVQTSTGLTLPLRYTGPTGQTLYQPSWTSLP